MVPYKDKSSQPMREFLAYHDTIKGQSPATIDSYFMDLRTFTRYLMLERGLVPRDADMEDIDVRGADLALYAGVTQSDVYDFLAYLSRNRGLTAASRARMITTLKGFYRYLTEKAELLSNNPVATLDTPKIPKTLPSFLSLEESQRLLQAVDGRNKVRDYCILSIFLNCGLRISELVGLDLPDIRPDHLLIHGKGNKERVVYLNNSCSAALEEWLKERERMQPGKERAVFLSSRRRRMSVDAVQLVVKNSLLRAGLDASRITPHKLRHTAATLMLQNNVDVRTLQEFLGHENLNTTQIYTHLSGRELKSAAMQNPLADYQLEDAPDEASKASPLPFQVVSVHKEKTEE